MCRPRHPNRADPLPRTKRRGLTMLELVIALSITVSAGLALSTVMTTVARSITSTTGARSALQRAHAAYVRLRAFTDASLCLLQHDPARGFALWLEDSNQNGSVNLREMRVFWFNASTGLLTVERVEFPETWPEEMKAEFDVPLSTGANFLNEMETQRSLGYTATLTMCDGLRAVALTHDGASPQQARRLWLRLTPDDTTPSPPQILTAYAFLGYKQPQ